MPETKDAEVVKTPEVPDVADAAGSAYGEWFFNIAKIFSRRCVEWFIVYMFGYYNASFGWLMAPLFFLVLRDKRAKEKRVKFDIARSIANADEKEILQEIQKFSSLPSWVTFPDMERVEWINKILKQLWPYAGHYVRDLCKHSIEPAIAEALTAYKLNGFKFDKMILGDTAPRISGLKVYDDTSLHEIIMDMDIIYAGDCKFEVSVSKISAGIKDVQLSGRMRVVMKPLVHQIPLIGGLQVFFLNNPELDFNLVGIADVFDMPGLSDILRSIVIDCIGSMMVLPNRYPLQLVEDINLVELKCPQPAGVIRIHVIEAKNLMKKDFGIMGKSDPYCILHLGAQKFQTKTINNTVNPTWDYCCEFQASVPHGQEINFEILDLDDGPGVDDLLGRANLDVHEIWKNGEIDTWVPLSDAKHGRLHIKATWLDLSESSNNLDMQLEEIRSLQGATKNPLHSAILMVWVDSAKKLNPSHKEIPDPYVKMHVGNTEFETAFKNRTNDPVFEEGFTFLVRNPKTQEFKLEIWDKKTETIQGKLELDLNILLKNEKMEVMGEEYSLSGSTGGMATVKLNLSLRILQTGQKETDGDNTAEKGEVENSNASTSIPDPSQSLGNITQPPQASAIPPVDVPVLESSVVSSEPIVKSVESKQEKPKSEVTGSVVTEADSSSSGVSVEPSTIELIPSAETVSLAAPVSSMQPEEGLRQRAVSKAGIHGLGRIHLSVKYGPKEHLVVVVHKVTNLPLEEDQEIPDPYVKLYLLPDKSKDSKRKTDVIKDEQNPVFDERFEYQISQNELTNRTLLVSVINKKGFFFGKKSASMGEVRLDCGLLDPDNVTQWYDLNPELESDDE